MQLLKDFEDLKAIRNKIGEKQFVEAMKKFSDAMTHEKTTGIQKSKTVAKEMEAWAKKQGWPAPDGKTLSEFFIRKFYEAETSEDQNLYSDPHLLYKDYKQHIENKLNTNRTFDPEKAMELIEPDLRNIFLEKESQAQNENGGWDSQIKCAAFCELLFEKKYLINRTNRIKHTHAFFKQRYGGNIEIQLKKGKKSERDKHKLMMANLFK